MSGKLHVECPGCSLMVRSLVIVVNPAAPGAPSVPILCQACASKYPGVKFRELKGVVTV